MERECQPSCLCSSSTSTVFIFQSDGFTQKMALSVWDGNADKFLELRVAIRQDMASVIAHEQGHMSAWR